MSSEDGNLLIIFYGSKVFVHESSLVVLPSAESPLCFLRCSRIRKNCAFVRTTIVILYVLCALTLSTSSSIIKEFLDMRQMGLAMVSFFYFDFRDGGKQEVRHLLSSILRVIQLCGQSDKFAEILSTVFEDHNRGSRQPSEEALVKSQFQRSAHYISS